MKEYRVGDVVIDKRSPKTQARIFSLQAGPYIVMIGLESLKDPTNRWIAGYDDLERRK